jgi:hypothetical protein
MQTMMRRAVFLACLALMSSACGRGGDSPAVAPPASPPAAPANDDAAFEADTKAAMETLATPEGAAYDEALGKYLASLPGYGASIKACIAASPGKQTVVGFLRFDAAGKYVVELRPRGAFADCLAKFLEGRAPPKPPRLPYLNSLSFTTEP